jgi:hypothetical protein
MKFTEGVNANVRPQIVYSFDVENGPISNDGRPVKPRRSFFPKNNKILKN